LLDLDEIYKLKLRKTRLVVLSACNSALGRYYKGEGIVSLVRPFLAAGAPTVVSSLWSIDSEATARLMIAFQKQRVHSSLTAGNALASAQRAMITQGQFDHPYYWAAFIVVGADNR
jgi:CHAT domain-containing protein